MMKLIIWMLLSYITTSNQQNSSKLHKISTKHEEPAIFERIATMKMVTEYVQIAEFIDLKKYDAAKKSLESSLNDIKILCNHTHAKCSYLQDIIQGKLNKLLSSSELWKFPSQKLPLNNKIEHEAQELNSIIENYNKIIDRLKEEKPIFLNQIQKVNTRFEIASKITKIGLVVMEMLNEIIEEQSQIIETMNSEEFRVRNPFISIEKITRELRYINNDLSSDTVLPFELESVELHDIIGHFLIKKYFSNDRLYYVISIPKVAKHSFELLKITPTPMVSETNLFEVVETPYHFLAIQDDNSVYFTPNSEELKLCKLVNEILLCNARKQYKQMTPDSCVIQMYSFRTTNFCKKAKLDSNQQIWIALHDPQSWFFALRESTEVSIYCANANETFFIPPSVGKLSMEKNCKLITDEIRLLTKTEVKPLGFLNFELINVVQNMTKKFSDSMFSLPGLLILLGILFIGCTLMILSIRGYTKLTKMKRGKELNYYLEIQKREFDHNQPLSLTYDEVIPIYRPPTPHRKSIFYGNGQNPLYDITFETQIESLEEMHYATTPSNRSVTSELYLPMKSFKTPNFKKEQTKTSEI